MLLFLFLLLGYNVLVKKYKKNKLLKLKYSRLFPLVILLLVVVILLILKIDSVKNLLTGFGSLVPRGVVAQTIEELKRTEVVNIWGYFWILGIFSLVGLFFLKPFNSKKAFFLGFLIPLVCMGLVSLRYSFLMSIPFIALSGVLFSWIIGVDKRARSVVVLILAILLMAFHGLSNIDLHLQSPVDDNMIEAFEYFRDNTGKESCLVADWSYGSHVGYFTKRHSYVSSVSQDANRVKQVGNFLLTDKEPDFWQDNMYVFVTENYLKYLGSMQKITGIQGINMSRRRNGYNCFYNSTKWGLIWLSDGLCKSNMIRMLKGEELAGLEKMYEKKGNSIYKVQEK
jgi:hypothetical protein